MTLYLAYGSNLNPDQMASRCPGAKFVEKIYLADAKLVFRGVLDVEFCPDSIVPCAMYEINGAHELDLDRYEGVRDGYYAKEYITLRDGRQALIYVMLTDGVCPPNAEYYSRVKEGYRYFKINFAWLESALDESWQAKNQTEATRRRMRHHKLLRSARLNYAKKGKGKIKAKAKGTLPMEVALDKQKKMSAKADTGKVTNLFDWLEERRAQGKSY
jgi:gamma-glutamylcyclotransferase (GGCT)/AIG2-like uncharacterized protein YtfP